jgi:mRNA interferase RelE/StbE
MYRVEFKRSAAKALKKIPRRDQKRIQDKIDGFCKGPPDPNITKMKGDNPFHRIRVGDYRIVYGIKADILIDLDIENRPSKQAGSAPNC